MVKSADGKGRTILEILTGRNKKDMTPLELQYHNPLKARVGVSVSIRHVLDVPSINFFVEAIEVWKTKVGNKDYFHTDYDLKGVTLDSPTPLRYRLRLIPNEDVSEGYTLQLLKNYYSCGWTEAEQMNLYDPSNPCVLQDQNGEFHINEDDQGVPYDEPVIFWRVGDERNSRDANGNLLGTPLDPYEARVTTLKDEDGNGKIDDDELTHRSVTYWDFHRETTDTDTDQKYVEYLSVEMDQETRQFTFLRGRSVEPFQIEII